MTRLLFALCAFFAVNASGQLDARRLAALSMIETGGRDAAVGRAGEVSRYQIDPGVWHSYSAVRNYRNPQAAADVARKHWQWLTTYFTTRAGRSPSDFDLYVLWNTRHGYYERRHFDRARLADHVRRRAERFVNLVGDYATAKSTKI